MASPSCRNALNIPNAKPILGKVEVEKLDDNSNPLRRFEVFNLEKYDGKWRI